MKQKTKFKQTEIGMIPEDWEIKEIEEEFEVNTGKGISTNKQLEIGDYPIYGGNGIIGYSQDFLVDGNFILTGRVGTIGEANCSFYCLSPLSV
jgi:type I restriction enzyme S subunit